MCCHAWNRLGVSIISFLNLQAGNILIIASVITLVLAGAFLLCSLRGWKIKLCTGEVLEAPAWRVVGLRCLVLSLVVLSVASAAAYWDSGAAPWLLLGAGAFCFVSAGYLRLYNGHGHPCYCGGD